MIYKTQRIALNPVLVSRWYTDRNICLVYLIAKFLTGKPSPISHERMGCNMNLWCI